MEKPEKNKPKVLILGAHPNADRYGNLVPKKLIALGYPVVLLGIRKGAIEGQPILQDWPKREAIDTVTMYLSAQNQKKWESYVLASKPRRVIFNPGAEHRAWYPELRAAGIEAVEACTLVLLSTGQF